mmetsp:Transcript_29591/g.83464  ORF Transcript_29591/g.83464 Transcript_29591/m.83464 type:complete len:433 (+) Transcript_29591:774-2072(+)
MKTAEGFPCCCSCPSIPGGVGGGIAPAGHLHQVLNEARVAQYARVCEAGVHPAAKLPAPSAPCCLCRLQRVNADGAVAIRVVHGGRAFVKAVGAVHPRYLDGSVDPEAIAVRHVDPLRKGREPRPAVELGDALQLLEAIREADVVEEGFVVLGGVVAAAHCPKDSAAEHLGGGEQQEVGLAGALLGPDGQRAHGRHPEVVARGKQLHDALAAAKGGADCHPVADVARPPRSRKAVEEPQSHQAAQAVAQQHHRSPAVPGNSVLHESLKTGKIGLCRDGAEVVRGPPDAAPLLAAKGSKCVDDSSKHDALPRLQGRVQVLHAAGVPPPGCPHLHPRHVGVGAAARGVVSHLHVVCPTVDLQWQQLLHIQPQAEPPRGVPPAEPVGRRGFTGKPRLQLAAAVPRDDDYRSLRRSLLLLVKAASGCCCCRPAGGL